MRWCSGIALLLLLAAGCQPMPRPFGDENAAKRNPLLELADRGGVVVLDVDGAPPAAAARLPAALAAALNALDVPAATSGGNRQSRFLQGRATALPAPGGRVRIDLHWDLVDGAGRSVGTVANAAEGSEAAWRTGEDRLIGEIATRAAAEVVTALGAQPLRGLATRALRVRTPDGLPPRDAETLRHAMETALRNNRLKLAERGDEGGPILAGRVFQAPVSGGLREVDVQWAILAPDGRELGRLGQRNAVPTEAIETEWPLIARQVADSAAPGVLEALEQLAPDTLAARPRISERR